MSIFKILINILILYSITLTSVNSYIQCDDGRSACGSGFICCKIPNENYSCCINSRTCCNQGRKCCETNSLFLNFLVENEIKNSLNSTDSFKIKGDSSTKIINKSIIKKIAEFLEKFLTEIKFSDYSKNISELKNNLKKISEYSIEIYQIIESIKEDNFTTEKLSNLSEKFSGFFNYTSKLIMNSGNVKSDISKLIEKINNYFSSEELKYKFIGSLIKNKIAIEKTIEEIKIYYLSYDYSKFGLTLGELFSIVLFDL